MGVSTWRWRCGESSRVESLAIESLISEFGMTNSGVNPRGSPVNVCAREREKERNAKANTLCYVCVCVCVCCLVQYQHRHLPRPQQLIFMLLLLLLFWVRIAIPFCWAVALLFWLNVALFITANTTIYSTKRRKKEREFYFGMKPS